VLALGRVFFLLKVSASIGLSYTGCSHGGFSPPSSRPLRFVQIGMDGR